MGSAFDRLSGKDGPLFAIQENTALVAETFGEDGEIFDRIDRMVTAIEGLAGKAGAKGDSGLKEAIVLNLVAPTLKPIGLGMGFIVEALNAAPDGEVLSSKFGAIASGLLLLGDIGMSVLKFAAAMVIALPILLIAAVTSPIWVGGIYILTKGLAMATDHLEGKSMENLMLLGVIGQQMVYFGLFMAAMVIIAPIAIIGMLFTVPLIMGVVWLAKYIDENLGEKSVEKFENFNKSMVILGLGILAIGLSLAFMALAFKQVMMGLLVTVLVLSVLGGIFLLWEKVFNIDQEKAEGYAKALAFLGIGIITIGLGLMLMNAFAGPIMMGLLVASLVLVTIGGIFWLFQKMGINKTIRKTSVGLMFAAGAILGLSIALALANLILPDFLDSLAVLATIGAVGLLFNIMGRAQANILKGALAMIAMGIGLFALAVGMGFFRLAMPGIAEGIGMLALLGGIGIVFGVMGMAFTNILLGSLAMIVAGVAMIVLGIGVIALMASLPDVPTGLGMLALIAGIGIVFGVAGLAAAFIALGGAAMIVAGVAMIILGAGVAVMASATKDITLEQAGVMALVIGGIGVVMAAAGLVSPLIILGSAAMIAAGVAVLAISVGVLALSKLDFTALGTVSEKGSKAFNWSGEKGFFGGKKTNFEVAMGAIADGMSLGPLSIIGIMAGAPTLILAGAALTGIAFGLRTFTNVIADVDLPKLSDNVKMIVSGLSETFADVGRKYPGGGGGILAALTGSGGDTSVVAQGISAVGGMGKALTGIAKGVQAMAMLKFPTGFDKDGNPTGYETIDLTSAVPNLIANTKLLVSGLSSVFAEVGESEAAQGSSWFTSSSYEKGIDVVTQMGTPLFNLANGVQAMANLKFPTGYDKDGNPTGFKSIGNVDGLVKKLAKNTKALIIGLAGVFEEVGASGVGGGGGWFSSSNFEKGAEIALALADPYAALADTVESVGKITAGIASGTELQEKVTAMIGVIAAAGEINKDNFWAGRGYAMYVADPYAALAATLEPIEKIITGVASGTDLKEKVYCMVAPISDVGLLDSNNFWTGRGYAMYVADPYASLASAIPSIEIITNGIASASDLKEKVHAMIDSITGSGEEDVDLPGRTKLIGVIGWTYQKLGVAIPLIVNALTSFTVEKGKAFMSVFAGETAPGEYAEKGNMLNILSKAYLTMSLAIPMLVGAVNTVEAEPFHAFSKIYGGVDNNIEVMAAKANLFESVGKAYGKIGSAAPSIAGAINSTPVEQMAAWTGMFIGDVGYFSPIKGYEAQTELWRSIGVSTTASGAAMPLIAQGINAMDLDKLVESRKMFEALGVLSSGGEPTDILAAMGESLEVAMEKLADILMTFQDSVGEAQESQGGLLTEIAKMPGNFVGAMSKGIGAGGSSGGGDNSAVVSAVNNLRKALITKGVKISNVDDLG